MPVACACRQKRLRSTQWPSACHVRVSAFACRCPEREPTFLASCLLTDPKTLTSTTGTLFTCRTVMGVRSLARDAVPFASTQHSPSTSTDTSLCKLSYGVCHRLCTWDYMFCRTGKSAVLQPKVWCNLHHVNVAEHSRCTLHGSCSCAHTGRLGSISNVKGSSSGARGCTLPTRLPSSPTRRRSIAAESFQPCCAFLVHSCLALL